MKNKFTIASPNIHTSLYPALGAFVLAAALVLVPVLYNSDNPVQVVLMCIPSVIAFAISAFFFYRTFKFHLHRLIINGKEIVLSSLFGTVKRVSWTTVESVQVCHFNSLDTVKRGSVNLGGIEVLIPKNIPNRWIMFADIREDFCENIYEFFVPNGDLRAIKVVYDEAIIDAVHYYTEKKIEYKNIG